MLATTLKEKLAPKNAKISRLCRNVMAIAHVPSVRKSAQWQYHPLFADTIATSGIDAVRDNDIMLSHAGLYCASPEEALVLTLQKMKTYDGSWTWLVNAFSSWTDYVGRLRFGGVEVCGNVQQSHHKFWFNPECVGLNPGLFLGRWLKTTQKTLEMANATNEAVQTGYSASEIAMPRMWYGYDKEDAFVYEDATPSFKARFVEILAKWDLAGRPQGFHALGDAAASVLDRWTRLEAVSYQYYRQNLDTKDMEYLNNSMWMGDILEFDGLRWLPSDYFYKRSPQKPWMPHKHLRKLLTYSEAASRVQIFQPVPPGAERHKLLNGVDFFGCEYSLIANR